jgi:hypothetical protein
MVSLGAAIAEASREPGVHGDLTGNSYAIDAPNPKLNDDGIALAQTKRECLLRMQHQIQPTPTIIFSVALSFPSHADKPRGKKFVVKTKAARRVNRARDCGSLLEFDRALLVYAPADSHIHWQADHVEGNMARLELLTPLSHATRQPPRPRR